VVYFDHRMAILLNVYVGSLQYMAHFALTKMYQPVPLQHSLGEDHSNDLRHGTPPFRVEMGQWGHPISLSQPPAPLPMSVPPTDWGKASCGVKKNRSSYFSNICLGLATDTTVPPFSPAAAHLLMQYHECVLTNSPNGIFSSHVVAMCASSSLTSHHPTTPM
jgi:hypothetical protein